MDLFLSFSEYSESVEPFLRALRNAREIRDDAGSSASEKLWAVEVLMELDKAEAW